MLYFFYSDQASKQARNQRGAGGQSPPQKNFHPPWKNVLDIV